MEERVSAEPLPRVFGWGAGFGFAVPRFALEFQAQDWGLTDESCGFPCELASELQQLHQHTQVRLA